MVKKFKRLFVVMLILLIPGISYAQDIKMPKFVAHAGGGINNLIYTNSLEALDSNYKKGFRFFCEYPC